MSENKVLTKILNEALEDVIEIFGSIYYSNMQKCESTGLVFFFPWVLKNDLLIKGFWQSFINTRDKIQGLVRNSIEEHKKTYDPLETRDFIDALIGQWKKTDDPNSSFYGDEGGTLIFSIINPFKTSKMLY